MVIINLPCYQNVHLWSSKWCAHCLKDDEKRTSKFMGCIWTCEKGSQLKNNYYTCVWPTFQVNANYCCLWHEGQGQAKILSHLWAIPTQPCAVVSIFKSYIRVIGMG
jgi:hypothetical protein